MKKLFAALICLGLAAGGVAQDEPASPNDTKHRNESGEGSRDNESWTDSTGGDSASQRSVSEPRKSAPEFSSSSRITQGSLDETMRKMEVKVGDLKQERSNKFKAKETVEAFSKLVADEKTGAENKAKLENVLKGLDEQKSATGELNETHSQTKMALEAVLGSDKDLASTIEAAAKNDLEKLQKDTSPEGQKKLKEAQQLAEAARFATHEARRRLSTLAPGDGTASKAFRELINGNGKLPDANDAKAAMEGAKLAKAISGLGGLKQHGSKEQQQETAKLLNSLINGHATTSDISADFAKLAGDTATNGSYNQAFRDFFGSIGKLDAFKEVTSTQAMEKAFAQSLRTVSQKYEARFDPTGQKLTAFQDKGGNTYLASGGYDEKAMKWEHEKRVEAISIAGKEKDPAKRAEMERAAYSAFVGDGTLQLVRFDSNNAPERYNTIFARKGQFGFGSTGGAGEEKVGNFPEHIRRIMGDIKKEDIRSNTFKGYVWGHQPNTVGPSIKEHSLTLFNVGVQSQDALDEKTKTASPAKDSESGPQPVPGTASPNEKKSIENKFGPNETITVLYDHAKKNYGFYYNYEADISGGGGNWGNILQSAAATDLKVFRPFSYDFSLQPSNAIMVRDAAGQRYSLMQPSGATGYRFIPHYDPVAASSSNVVITPGPD